MTARAESGPFEFLCDLRDVMSREVCFTGTYEPQETALLRRLLGPGMTVVDVGANWGYHTLLAARLVGADGRVISLEPHPGVYAKLESNVERNRVTHVTPVRMAAADRAGIVQLAEYDDVGGNFGVAHLEMDGPAGRGHEVKADVLDTILRQLHVGVIDVMKMDIEGAEGLALRGAEELLRVGAIGYLLLELHPSRLMGGETAETILNRLAGFGYQAWSIDHSAEATRRLAYGRASTVAMLLPGSDHALRDAWPHVLLTAPGRELPASVDPRR